MLQKVNDKTELELFLCLCYRSSINFRVDIKRINEIHYLCCCKVRIELIIKSKLISRCEKWYKNVQKLTGRAIYCQCTI